MSGNSDLINGASPYFTDKDYRKKELQAQASISPTPQATIAYLIAQLQAITRKPMMNLSDFVDGLRLLAEIQAETLMQAPQTIDYSGLPSIQGEYQRQTWAHNKRIYDQAVASDWEVVIKRYNETKEFYLDLGGGIRVFPVVLDTQTLTEDVRYATKPLATIGRCLTFNLEEEREARKTEAEMLRGNDQAYYHLSMGQLKTAEWSLDCYSGVPEPIYQSFKRVIDAKLDGFQAEHGGLTRKLTFQRNAVIYHALADSFVTAYRVVIDEPQEPQSPSVEATSPNLGEVTSEKSRWAKLLGR